MPTITLRQAAWPLAAALALASGAARALEAQPDIPGGLLEARRVWANDLTGTLINEDGSINDLGPAHVSIDLGPQPHSAVRFDPTVAEAYSKVTGGAELGLTYWNHVSAYPGCSGVSPNCNYGRAGSQVQINVGMIKQADNAVLTLHITGGRLQLMDYTYREPLMAMLNLDTTIYSGNTLVTEHYVAVLAGHGGPTGVETFDGTWQGLQASYLEQRSSWGDLVGATLDIPAQDIQVDISHILAAPFSDGKFMLSIDSRVEAMAMYADGGGAMAFLRDPVAMGQADPTLGGMTLSMSGIALAAAPVPEPATWALWLGALAGLGALRGRGAAPQRGVPKSIVQ